MKPRISFIHALTLTALSLGLTACSSRPDPRLPEAASAPIPDPGGPRRSDPGVLDQVWTDDTWVGVMPDDSDTCPVPGPARGGTWKTGRLFEQTLDTEPPDQPPPSVEGERARYCVYEWSSPADAAPDLAPLEALRGSGLELDRDGHAMAPTAAGASNIITRMVWKRLRSAVHRHVDRVERLPGPAQGPDRIRVAVIDASPPGAGEERRDGVPNDGRLGHGMAVGMVAREFGCPLPLEPEAPCVAQVVNYLGLPVVKGRKLDLEHGGYSGHLSHLAISINSAVSDWVYHLENAAPEERHNRLIINLSVGWDPDFGGAVETSPRELRPAIRAVYKALTRAACRGALVIVAAGNAPGGPDPSGGPMYPAGWETEFAPDRAQCEQYVAQANSDGRRRYSEWLAREASRGRRVFAPTGVYRPLVHAVGAVRADDRPIVLTRAGGRPRLAAVGAHVVAPTWTHGGQQAPDEDSGPTEVLTGTSMAAAVVSGVAASVWAYRPELSPAEVMDIVYSSGVALNRGAEFYLAGSGAAPRIRRVSQCRALAKACAKGDGHCPRRRGRRPGGKPPMAHCKTLAAYAGKLPEFAVTNSLPATVSVTRRSARGLVHRLRPIPLCQHKAFVTDRKRYPDTVCPYRQYYSWLRRPGGGPQPYDHGCPACGAEVHSSVAAAGTGATTYTATLLIAVNDELNPAAEIVNPTLIVDGVEYDLSSVVQNNSGVVGKLDVGQILEVSDIPLDGVPKQASIAFEVLAGDESFSNLSELLLTVN
ncbi:S8/S53 family peptidase [Haliangium sp.]|uniref:S8/S53 family peptidase n=1 Tax=Haliangium sp. TaxID=2663208 RepID=UPI003D0C886A